MSAYLIYGVNLLEQVYDDSSNSQMKVSIHWRSKKSFYGTIIRIDLFIYSSTDSDSHI